MQNTKSSHRPLSLHAMIMSWHRVHSIHQLQHPPNIVSLHVILIIRSWPLIVASASRVPLYMIDCHQPALHGNSKVKSPCHIPTVARYLTDDYSLSTRRTVHRPLLSTSPIRVDHSIQMHLQTHSIIASTFPLSWRPTAHHQTCSIMASKCISNLTWLRSPSSHDHGLQVHLQTCSITASKAAQLWPPSANLHIHSPVAYKCISKLARSWPPSEYPHSVNYGFQVRRSVISQWISILPWSESWSVFQSSYDQGSQLYLRISLIAASKCLSTLPWSRPWNVSLSLLNRYVQAHLELLSITACSQSRYTVWTRAAV